MRVVASGEINDAQGGYQAKDSDRYTNEYIFWDRMSDHGAESFTLWEGGQASLYSEFRTVNWGW